MKRLFDITIVVLLVPFLALFLIGIAVLIKIGSPGAALYRARRVGQYGRPFTMYKFRTMAVSDEAGSPLTRSGDSRVTRVGGLLRRYRLDELPQLINVVIGDMSLVGPRPEDPAFVAHYSSRERRVLSVRPGITGPAQLSFRNEAELLTGDDYENRYIEDVMPRKLSIDLDYVDHQCLRTDLAIMVKTLLAIIRGS